MSGSWLGFGAREIRRKQNHECLFLSWPKGCGLKHAHGLAPCKHGGEEHTGTFLCGLF